MTNASILIATHKRNHVLKWNIKSLIAQKNDVEIIVLDDYFQPDTECEQLVNQFKSTTNIRYVHTGVTKQGKDYWRIPGYAYNIGAKQSSSDILILCCGEMYQVGNTTQFIIDTITNDPNQLCSVNGVDDKGPFLKKLESGQQISTTDCNQPNVPKLQITLPFFMGISRKHFFEIGGYDETFTGVSYDDDDLIHRLIRNGAKISHQSTKDQSKYIAVIDIPPHLFSIHLSTPHIGGNNCKVEDVHYNRDLFNRNNDNQTIVANINKNWGTI